MTILQHVAISPTASIGLRHANVTRLSAVALLLFAGASQAQTTFDVIGPHEYALPVDFKPFNVFVQYGTFQDNARVYNDDGDSVRGPGSHAITGLSKYVRFWSPESNRQIGVAWEVIVPEVSVRNPGAASGDRLTSGIGDPLTGFAIWFKPKGNITFGFQSFMQMPMGTQGVSDTNWKNLSSFLWDWQIGKFDWEGDAGVVWQGKRTDDRIKPGLTWHTNHRFAYRVTTRLEPFLALDSEHYSGTGGQPDSWVVDAGLGLMVHTFNNQSITMRYSTSIAGNNHSVNDSFNLKYAYVW